MRTPKFLSLFSGLGGLDLGLSVAGFKHIAASDSDLKCIESLSTNFPRTRIVPSDIHDLAKDIYPKDFGLRSGELELLAGAPPCQPFSKAAQWSKSGMKGSKDPRASTVSAFFEIARRFAPRVILMENVPGFISGKLSMLGELQSSVDYLTSKTRYKYRLDSVCVDSANFGIPQSRKRAIVLITRNYSSDETPFSGYEFEPRTAWDALYELDFCTKSLPQLSGWAELLPSIPEGSNYLWHTSRGGGEELFGYRTRYWSFLLKLARDRPAWTIAAQPGPNTGPFHWDNRHLAIQELLRLQTFPADWVVSGSRRDQIRQIGNATPPLLGEFLGKWIRSNVLGHRVSIKNLKLAISQAKFPPPQPTQPRALPRKFRSQVSPRAAHPGTGKGPSPLRM